MLYKFSALFSEVTNVTAFESILRHMIA